MNDAWILAILLIILEVRRMVAEYRLSRQLQSLSPKPREPAPEVVALNPEPQEEKPKEKDKGGVTLMTAERDARILEDEDAF